MANIIEQQKITPQTKKQNLFYRFDSLVKIFIPNFNVRAILYMTLIFALALFLQIWRVTK